MNHEGFRPRRLGRANLFARHLERSVNFYSRVCGVQLVRREPGIEAAFHTNGNTGVPIRDSQGTAIKGSVVIEDADGIMVELYAPRTATLPLPDTQRAGAARTWWFAA